MSELLLVGGGAIMGAVAVKVRSFVIEAKERYPEKSTWDAVKRLVDRKIWWATQG